MQDPNLTTTYWNFFINTVTEHQKSVHRFFLSWSQTWISVIGRGALPMSCWNAEYPESVKNLHNLTCIRAFIKALHSSLTVIHTIITVGLFKWHVYKLPEVRCHHNSLYPCYPFKYTLYSFSVCLSSSHLEGHHRSALAANRPTILFLDSKTTKVTAITLIPCAKRGTDN